MNRRTLRVLIAVIVVLIFLVVFGTSVLFFAKPAQEAPLPSAPEEAALALQQAVIPERDLTQIAPRLRKDLALLTPEPTPVAPARRVGDMDSFYVVQNATTGTYRTITATLQAVTPHSYYWVEGGITLDQPALQKAADYFESTIYPTNHKYFGSERSPGPDGDVRINILNTRFQDAAGYFSTEDTYPRSLVPYSNERNIIYLNVDALRPENDQYSADTAHEFQHLIHSYEAQHKTGWIDEGMGDLAIKLNGFPVLGVLDTFGRTPDTQLNTWAVDPRASAAHYAASYLFFDYAAERFGPQFTRDVIHAPSEGINGIQSVLDAAEGGIRFDDLFADWAVANYLNDPSVSNGRYAYPNEPTFHISREPVLGQFPISRTAQMNEYASSYYTLQPAGGDVTLYFTGTTTAKLLPVDAHSGQWDWYSNRADLADMTLTRPVDLTDVDKATLSYWTWYDIEEGFDYAYVEASTDEGKTWDILAGQHSSTVNPNGASYGSAYTGVSASNDQSPAQWIQDQVDLTSYARKKILIRFEYVTDDGYNRPGWALDDISIPEINFADSVENGNNGWDVQGFVRSDNVLLQHFTVQVVEKGSTTRVFPVPLDDQNRGSLTIAGFGAGVTGAELVITSGAPTTTEQTGYEFSVVPK